MGRWKITRVQCPHCHGSRKLDGRPCPYCGGKGFLAKKDKPPRKVERVSEQNVMGSSSSVSGTGAIATTDPLIKKKPLSRIKPQTTKFGSGGGEGY